jgi:hypothetical protein
MGACHAPDKSPLYAYLSILPYLIPFLYVILGLVLRSIDHLKVCAMLASGYVVGDKLCKPLFKSTFHTIEARDLTTPARAVSVCPARTWS